MSATDSTFRVEYAKSDRSKCKSCWSSIDTDSFRFTFMTYSSKFDAKEDQDKIRHRIQENATALSSGNDVNDTFSVQYAKSNRSTCHSCDKSIDKDTLRLLRTNYTSKRARSYGPTDEWYHLIDTVTDCMTFGALEPCPECGGLLIFKPDYDSKSPLNGYSIALVGRDTVVTTIDKTVDVIISTQDEVQKGNKKIQDAQYFEIHIVPEQFLDDILNDRSSVVMEKLKLSTCGKLPHIRKQQNKNFRLHLNLWDGIAVDPDSGLEETCHVLKDNETGDIFATVLGMIDITRDTNSYYKIQLLENNNDKNEIDYKQHSNDDDDIQKALNNSNAKNCSHLPSPVQDLIRLIFNIETMKETLLAFEIDLTKMPLGKFNRFYTLVPHDFGLKKLKILDNIELIQSKTQMINNLLETEIAYSLLKGSTDKENEHPIDVHYKKN
ncbi:unnamed protein product [Rotaria sp. Silwood1]|nr:unnamed protein product [Rotaria sp. Silwood1]